VVVTAAVFLCPSRAAAQTRAEQWTAIAFDALARFRAGDDGRQRSNTYAWALEAELRLNGDTPYARDLLNTLYGQRKPDGGWGLPFAYDVLGDGTVNDVDTTYTVTLAGHVGPPLLYAYQHGIDQVTAPDGTVWSIKAQIQRIVYLLATTPRIDNDQGACIAYSRNPNDQVSYGCIHNASAGAAAFLWQANAAGLGRGGLAALVEGVTRREVYDYKPAGLVCGGVARSNWWLYAGTRSCNDADHNSYDAESMYVLAPLIGQNTAWMHMTTAWADNSNAPVAHFRLAALPGAPGRVDAASGLPIWCVLGDRWISEAQAFLDTATDLQRVTQVAQGAARVADNCRPPGAV